MKVGKGRPQLTNARALRTVGRTMDPMGSSCRTWKVIAPSMVQMMMEEAIRGRTQRLIAAPTSTPPIRSRIMSGVTPNCSRRKTRT